MKQTLLSAVLCFCYLISYAQYGLGRKELDEKGIITFAEFHPDSMKKSLSETKQFLKDVLKIKQYDDLILTETKNDELGFTHQYFAQYYKGIRVAYSSYSAHGKNNVIHSINGRFQNVGNVSTSPSLSEKDALTSALRFINSKSYKWEVPEEENWLKENYNQSYYPKAELVIIKNIRKQINEFRLAYKFDVYSHSPVSRYLIYVDAINGEILDMDSKIHHTNSNGTAATRYSGTRVITSDSFIGGFRLRETRNNVRVETYNMKNQGTSYSGAPDFIDNDNTWSAIEYNNSSLDNAALDAHWGAEMVYEYFNTVHGRNSWNGTGGPLLSYVHTNLIAFGFPNNDNAFWDGQRMTYGDGTWSFSPLTSLDVCAHEIGHGINSSSAKMKYEGESGALNEALSDIWAATIEFWAAPEKSTWLIGEDITLFGSALRSMSRPKDYNQPDTYRSSTYWFNTEGCSPNNNNDRCGVHINSGVVNFWYFLLVNGGYGSNDIGSCYNVGGIGIEKAAKIVYRAETVLLNSSNEQFITFSQFRDATIIAAQNLYGYNSIEVANLTKSWFAVGVGSDYQYGANDIVGALACTNTNTFTLNNIPPNSTATWSVSPSNLFTVNTGTGNTANLVAASSTTSGAATITFTFNTCGNQIQVQKNIWVGPPTITFIEKFCVGTEAIFRFRAPSISGATYTWSINNPNLGLVYQGNYCEVSGAPIMSSQSYTLTLTMSQGPCSLTKTQNRVYSTCGGGGGGGPLKVFPNPASNEITIEYSPDSNESAESILIELINPSFIKVYSIETHETNTTIPLQNLPNGIYFLHLTNKEGIIKRNILIERK